VDIEIEVGELEERMEEELQMMAIQGKAKGEEALKERQTKERQLMIDLLLKDNVHASTNETINGYLEKEKRSLDRDLERFKRDKLKEKSTRLKDLEDMRRKREEELKAKKDSMLSWESQAKAEEAKHMEIFNKQKAAIMKQKLAEQQQQMLRQANQGSIEALKAEHLQALAMLETALEEEHRR
jgi:hypothetical protein